MNLSSRSSAIVALMLGLIVACQLEVDGKALDTVKGMAKSVAENAAKKANETEAEPQTGGIRSTIAHTGVSLVAEKAIDVIGAKYPVVKPFAPLAKPLVNKAHKAINNMFKKAKGNEEGEQKEEEGAAKSEEKKSDEKEPQKVGLLSKIKSAVGADGDKKEELEETKSAEPSKVKDEAKVESQEKVERAKPKREEEAKEEEEEGEEQTSGQEAAETEEKGAKGGSKKEKRSGKKVKG